MAYEVLKYADKEEFMKKRKKQLLMVMTSCKIYVIINYDKDIILVKEKL